MTYPVLGSNCSGYSLANAFRHSIIEPVPSALPLESKNKLSHLLQGVKLEAQATSIIDGDEIKKSIDDVMFTNYGLSGPAILNISREISIQINRLKRKNCIVKLNFLPRMNLLEIEVMLEKRWAQRPDQSIENSLIGLSPTKFPSALLEILVINLNKKVLDLSQEERRSIFTSLLHPT